MVARTDGHDDAFGTCNVYIKSAPGVCMEIESRGGNWHGLLACPAQGVNVYPEFFP